MRPSKQINPGAHNAGTGRATGKARHFAPQGAPDPAEQRQSAASAKDGSDTPTVPQKYVGRASVGHIADSEAGPQPGASGQTEWVDPLDQDDLDLTQITIDLRDTMRPDPPETYFQRFSSRVPDHQ